MKLTGPQIRQLHGALLDAFPNPSDLERLVLFHMEQRLNQIAGGNTYSDVVFRLIEWVIANDQVAALISAARKQNSGNRALSAVETDFAALLSANTTGDPPPLRLEGSTLATTAGPASVPGPDLDGFLYDAFISYSSKDRAWVETHLLPRLQATGLHVCIDYRDFEIGVPSVINMEQAVERSRKTLLVVTPDWVSSQWTDFESLLIQTQDPVGRNRRILPLMVKRSTLPKRLALFTYLDLTDPQRLDSQMERLITTIRTSPLPTEAGTGSSGQAAQPVQRQGSNPFVYGPAVAPEGFYGRRGQLADVKNRIGARSAQCISIVGLRRSGKSSLLRYVRGRIHEFCSPEQAPLIVSLDLQDRRFQTPAGLLDGIRRVIEKQTGRAPWPREANDDPWVVGDGLEALRDEGRRLIVLLDEFESISTRLEQFHNWGDDWRAKASAGYMALVIATTRPLDEVYTASGLTSPFGNLFTTTILGALNTVEWQTLVRDGFSPDGVSAADLTLIDDLAGGLPFYTQMAAAFLWQHGDPAMVRAEFKRQAIPRFVDLWNDLQQAEHLALRHAAGAPGVAVPSPAIRTRLTDHGLLRPDGRLFSSAFAEFVLQQP